MATAIKAIPTLYGDAARRFRDMADEAEMRYERSEKKTGIKTRLSSLCEKC